MAAEQHVLLVDRRHRPAVQPLLGRHAAGVDLAPGNTAINRVLDEDLQVLRVVSRRPAEGRAGAVGPTENSFGREVEAQPGRRAVDDDEALWPGSGPQRRGLCDRLDQSNAKTAFAPVRAVVLREVDPEPLTDEFDDLRRIPGSALVPRHVDPDVPRTIEHLLVGADVDPDPRGIDVVRPYRAHRPRRRKRYLLRRRPLGRPLAARRLAGGLLAIRGEVALENGIQRTAADRQGEKCSQ